MAKSPSLRNRLAAEFIGTLFFVFIAAGSVVAANMLGITSAFALLFIALTTGIALSLAVSITMGISGGQLNPAVTVGLFASGKMELRDSIAYIIFQVLGAAVGASLLFALFPSAIGNAVFWGTPTLGTSVSILQAIAAEAMLTFFLMLAVFGTAVDPRAPKIGGFGIGLTVFADAMVGGAITGAAMNPARAIGPAIASLHFANWYVYWAGPIIGAVIAALVYKELILK